MPGSFVDVIELLLPELRRRGLFQEDYAVPGGTYRENLREEPGQRHPPRDHPAGKMQWRAPSMDERVGSKPDTSGRPTSLEVIDPQAMQIG